MKSYKIKPAVSRVIARNEMRSFASRPKLSPTTDPTSRVFAICARIGIGALYFACVVAAVA
jgi:hypothetical protein